MNSLWEIAPYTPSVRITPQIPSGNFAGDFSRNSRKFYGLLHDALWIGSGDLSLNSLCPSKSFSGIPTRVYTRIPAIISYGKLFRIMEIPRRNFLRIPKILVGGIPEGNSADESKELKDSLEGIQQQKHG